MNACTIVARNYLAFARTLARSYREHHPDGTFWVLVVDDVRHEVDDSAEPFRVLRLDDLDLGPGELHRMATTYDVTELATAVKPWLLKHLLTTRPEAVYLDPDIRVYGNLDDIGALAREKGIVLTPHATDPIPRDGLRPSESEILASGVYNLGFIGVGPAAVPMLDWWSERLRRDCVIDHQRMLFTDQRWIDFVPAYFEPAIVRDPGLNVAYWNLHAREVRRAGDGWTVNGVPLRFFHFSGFKPELPDRLSKHQGDHPRVRLDVDPDLRALFDGYADALRDNGYGATAAEPYAWDTTPGGLKLDNRMRRVYREALVAWERGDAGAAEPPNPFADGRDEPFLAWLRSPAPVSRYLLDLYASRPDVKAAFPEVPGADAPRFLRWVVADGAQQEQVPGALLPEAPPVTAAATAVATARDARALAAKVKRRVRDKLAARQPTVAGAPRAAAPRRPEYVKPDELRPGVNVAGYFKAELGVGEGGRLLLETIEAAGVDHSTVTTTKTSSRQDHPFVDRGRSGAPYDVNIVCVNADQTPHFARDVGPEFFDGRYTIGMWHWEVEDFPPVMHPGLDFVDEVWCGSEFTRDSVAKSTDKPVYAFTLPVRTPTYPDTVTRADLGLPDDRFVFLFAFDFFSILERKNPMAVVRAFTEAFAPGEGPLLVLKSVNGAKVPEKLAALRAAVGDRDDVVVRDEYLSAEHKAALMGLVDCYVSLHRSEGYGLTMAEAMALGKPVVATAYSGNLDFMTAENSWLVPYRLVPVPPGCDPYPEGSRWADPDVAAAAAAMRQVYDDPAESKARGEQARADIATRHSVEARVPFVRERLADVARRRPTARLAAEDVRRNLDRYAPALGGTVLPPERGIERAVRLVNTVPDPRAATDKGALAYAVRRVVNRLTRQQTEYQREVNMALAVGLHELSQRLEATVDELGATVRDQLDRALTDGWSYELGLQMRAHMYSLLVDNGMRRMQTYANIAALRDRVAGATTLTPYEMRVFSQNGEDGVVAELLRRLGEGGRFFVEFGVESGQEGNCVLLADVLGWRGVFLEADDAFFEQLRGKYAGSTSVTTVKSMVTPDNVERVFAEAGVPPEPDLVSIDIDGNDYWVWRAMESFRPRILVVEYNSSLPPDRALVQPYAEEFWQGTDFFGASVEAMRRLGREKGYTLVHLELAGVNAFFVRDDLVPALGELTPPEPRSPNYFLNAQRHPRDESGRRYLDLDTDDLVDPPR